MLELLGAVWGLLSGLLLSLWTGVILIGTFVASVLTHLHTDMPRIEGLLIGVLFTWLLARRDRHPLLRVLSSPLRLVLAILDLAWDQCMDVVGDLIETIVEWFKKVTTYTKNVFHGVWAKLIDGLTALKNKLAKSGE
jgi:hypothetical protein